VKALEERSLRALRLLGRLSTNAAIERSLATPSASNKETALHVILKVFARIFHRFADVGMGGKMHDGLSLAS